MQQKYGKDGFVLISVSLDLSNARLSDEDVKPEDMARKVRDFLKEKKVAFDALLMDESAEFLQQKLHFQLSPCAFVFSRQGQWTQFGGDDNAFDAKKIEELVEKLVREK